MSGKSRLESLQQSRDRRMKRIAAGGGVLLAIVLAWEVPHYLGGSKAPAPAATTSAAGTGGTSTTPATTDAGTAAAAPTMPTRLPNTDVSPRRTKSQLSSFSHFASKDPFVQQVSTQSPSSAAPTTAPPSSKSPRPSGSSGTSQSSTTQQSSARTLAQTGSATIEVNGKSESVGVGATFPSSNPVFKLVSLANGVAQIGIASGSYSSGAQTVSLVAGKTLTLVDTTDGTRYELKLVSGP
jgi:hypothetical protein